MHTPGPWTLAYEDSNYQKVVRSKHFEIATCWHHCVGSIEKEMYYNAKLIAAAPDLLRELKLAVQRLEDEGCEFNSVQFKEAIAKAEGR